jgi:diadenosine tetraphosphate (Ap4A) HIT family hydrolase
MNLDHWAKFRPSDLTCSEFDHWLVVVRQKQVTLGDCVFLLKRPVESLGMVSAAELSEFSNVAGWFERATRGLYGAERFNYLAAMMKDPYVHFHAFPRYSISSKRYGQEWRDEAWPRAIELHDVSTSSEVLLAIRADLSSTES